MAPVHPKNHNINKNYLNNKSLLFLFSVVSYVFLTPKVTGSFKCRKIKSCCNSFPCNFWNAVHCIHKPQFDRLATVVCILHKNAQKWHWEWIKKTKSLWQFFEITDAKINTWNRSCAFLPKTCSCWLDPSRTAFSRWEKRGHTKSSQCKMKLCKENGEFNPRKCAAKCVFLYTGFCCAAKQ